jgi:hypothetical protein
MVPLTTLRRGRCSSGVCASLRCQWVPLGRRCGEITTFAGYALGVMTDQESRRLERILSDRLERETGKPARVTVTEGYAHVQSGAGEIVRYRVAPEAYDNLATYERDRSGVAFPDGLLIPDTREHDQR